MREDEDYVIEEGYERRGYSAPPPAVPGAPEDAVQWLVKRLHNGRPQELGTIAIQSSIDDIVAKWNRSGTYQLYPLDMTGSVCRGYEREPAVVDIPEDHQAFKKVRAQGAVGPAPAGSSVDVVGLVQSMQRASEAQTRELAASNQRLQEQLAQMMQQVGQERLSMAVSTAGDTAEFFKEMSERENARAERSMSQMLQLLTAQQTAQQRQHEQMMERLQMQARLDREQSEADRRRERERLEDERRRELEMRDRRAREEAEMAKRDTEGQERRFERQREQDQQFFAQTLTLLEKQAKASDPVAQMQAVAGTVAAVAGTLGIEVKDVDWGTMLKRVLGGEEKKPEGFADVAANLVSKGLEAAIAIKQAEAAQANVIEADEEGEEDDPMVVVDMPGQGPTQMRRSEYEALVEQARQQQAAQQRAIAQQDGRTQIQVGGPPPEAPAPQEPPPAPPKPVDPLADVPRATAKAGRRAIRAIVMECKAKPEAEWNDLVTNAFMANMDTILPVISGLGLRRAIRQAGAEPELAKRLVAAIAAHPMVPASIGES